MIADAVVLLGGFALGAYAAFGGFVDLRFLAGAYFSARARS